VAAQSELLLNFPAHPQPAPKFPNLHSRFQHTQANRIQLAAGRYPFCLHSKPIPRTSISYTFQAVSHPVTRFAVAFLIQILRIKLPGGCRHLRCRATLVRTARSHCAGCIGQTGQTVSKPWSQSRQVAAASFLAAASHLHNRCSDISPATLQEPGCIVPGRCR
jgi:hypothetical protein